MEGFINNTDLSSRFPFTAFKYTAHGTDDGTHWHKYMQVALCLNGSGKFFFSNKEYEVSEGDIFVANNFESHVAVGAEGISADYLFIIFLPELIAYPGCRQFDFEYLYPFRYDSKTFDNKISNRLEISKQLKEIILKLDDIWAKKDLNCEYQIDAYLRLLLSILIKYYKQTNKDYFSFDSKKHNKLQDALNYINMHYLEKITLEEISTEFYMSSSRFRHLFKETMNMGFKEYVTYLRLSEAKKLLIYNNMNIKEISMRCAYTNLNQFYKDFNKYVHMMPDKYRKNHKS